MNDSEHEKLLHLLKTKKKRNYFRKLFQTIQDRKLFQNQPTLPPETPVIEWRHEKRIKTIHVALCVCLNIGVDPPDVIKVEPCSKLECWVDPTKPKALEEIGGNLKTQFKRWQPRARYKHILDGTIDDTRKTCIQLRKSAKKERILFYYNGHGVPKPTSNGEIWVYNKDYTQYIPISIADLSMWMSLPAMYIFDCSHAGVLIKHFLAVTNQQEIDPKETEKLKDELIILCSCSPNEDLPTNADLPADLFTSCLTTPIKMALHWFLINNKLLKGRVTHDMIASAIDYNHLKDRKTPFGELNWIFTAVTDTIAWSVLPQELFHKLFRQDLLLASMFRNYLLACRIMYSVNCTPVSYPALPPTHNHPMWKAWDLVVDMCVSQLPEMKANPNYEYKFSNFFSSQLTDFEVWLTFSGRKTKPPAQLPILLQVLLSQEHRVRALKLIARFLDTSPAAVNLVLSVGIFPYVVKLLQSGTRELRPILSFIWGKMLELDRSCQGELVKDDGHIQFIRLLINREESSSVWLKTIASFVLSSICCKYLPGQSGCFGQNLLETLKKELPNAPKNETNLIKWLILCLAKMVEDYPAAQDAAFRLYHFEKIMRKFIGNSEPPEIRACAVYALSCLIGKEENIENDQQKKTEPQPKNEMNVNTSKKSSPGSGKARNSSKKDADSGSDQNSDEDGSEQGSDEEEDEDEEEEEESSEANSKKSANRQRTEENEENEGSDEEEEEEDDDEDGENGEENENDRENLESEEENEEEESNEREPQQQQRNRSSSRKSNSEDAQNEEEEEEYDEEEAYRTAQQKKAADKENRNFKKHVAIGSVLWGALEDPSNIVREEVIYALAKIIRTYGDYLCPELISHMIEDQEQKMMQCVLMASTSTIKSTSSTMQPNTPQTNPIPPKEAEIKVETTKNSSPPAANSSLGSESDQTVSESSDSFQLNESYNNAKKIIRNSAALPFSSKEYLDIHRQKQMHEIEQQSMKHKAIFSNLNKNSASSYKKGKEDSKTEQLTGNNSSNNIPTSQYCDLRGRTLDRISFFTMDMFQLILMFCADPMVKVSDLAYSVLENIKENYLFSCSNPKEDGILSQNASLNIALNSPSSNASNIPNFGIVNSTSSNNLTSFGSQGPNSLINPLVNTASNPNLLNFPNNSLSSFNAQLRRSQQQLNPNLAQNRVTPTQNLEILRNNNNNNANASANTINSKLSASFSNLSNQKRASVKIQSGIGLTKQNLIGSQNFAPKVSTTIWPTSILFEYCVASFSQIRFQDESPQNSQSFAQIAISPSNSQQFPQSSSDMEQIKPQQLQKLVQHEKLMISAVTAAPTSGKKKIENQVGLFGNENNEIITKLLFHPFEDYLLSANESDSITVWDWVNQQKLKTINVSPVLKGRVSDFQIINENTDNPLLMVAGSSGNIAFFKNILTDSTEVVGIIDSATLSTTANGLSSVISGGSSTNSSGASVVAAGTVSTSSISKFLGSKIPAIPSISSSSASLLSPSNSSNSSGPNSGVTSSTNSFLKIFPCYYNVAAGFSVLPGAEALYYNLEVDPVVAWQPAHSLLYVGGWGIGDVKIYDLVKEQCVSRVQITNSKDFGTGVTAITTDIFGGGFVFGAGTNKGDIYLVDRRMKPAGSASSGSSMLGSSPDVSGLESGISGGYLSNTANIVQKMQASHKSYVVNITKQRITSFEVISASSSSDVHFWDTRLAGAPPARTFSIQKGSLTAFAVHPFSPLFVSGSNSQFIKICNTAGETLSMIYYHEGFLGQRIGPVASLAWHPYKNLFACGCSDGIISLFR